MSLPFEFDFRETGVREANKKDLVGEDLTNLIKTQSGALKEFQAKRFRHIENFIKQLNNLDRIEPKNNINFQSLIGEKIDILREIKRQIDPFLKKELNNIEKLDKLLNILRNKEFKSSKFREREITFLIDQRKDIREAIRKLERLKNSTEDILVSNLSYKKLIGLRERAGAVEPTTQDNKRLMAIENALSNRGVGTVASLGGFAGITTASILARIIGNSTANYISPHSNTIIKNISSNDDKRNLLRNQEEEFRTLKKEIEHLKDLEEHKKDRGQKRRVIKHRRVKKLKKDINLINIVNRM